MSDQLIGVLIGGVIGVLAAFVGSLANQLLALRREERLQRLLWQKEYREKRLLPLREELDRAARGPMKWMARYWEYAAFSDSVSASAESDFGADTTTPAAPGPSDYRWGLQFGQSGERGHPTRRRQGRRPLGVVAGWIPGRRALCVPEWLCAPDRTGDASAQRAGWGRQLAVGYLLDDEERLEQRRGDGVLVGCQRESGAPADILTFREGISNSQLLEVAPCRGNLLLPVS